jgi:hypothetical protein
MENKLKVVRLSGRYVRQDDKKAIERVNQATPSGDRLVKVAPARAAKIYALRKTMGLETA